MNEIIKIYRKLFFLTNPRYDRFERLLFVLNIPLIILGLAFLEQERFDEDGWWSLFLLTFLLSYSLKILNILFILVKWVAEPFFKKK